MIKYLQDALFNNGLAVLLTLGGLAYATLQIQSRYELWQAGRTADKQTQAIITRCAEDEQAKNEIETQATQAITSGTNDFINQ